MPYDPNVTYDKDGNEYRKNDSGYESRAGNPSGRSKVWKRKQRKFSGLEKLLFKITSTDYDDDEPPYRLTNTD